MKLLRAATLSVANLDAASANYCQWLDYEVAERGEIDAELAASWGTPAATGKPYAVLSPASGREVFLRFVENVAHPDYRPLRSYGWAAIEICVQDVLATAKRMADSPFEIIGPPREIDGLPAIYPMQVRGPDAEIVYLTQIRDDLPEFDLPRAAAPIDRLFILVLACSDLEASLDWLVEHARLQVGRRKLEIVYTMLAKAFDLPEEDLHTIATMVHGRDVFLELDQYPPAATTRPGDNHDLPQGVAIGSFRHPEFAAIASSAPAIAPPAHFDSVVYGGRRALTLRAPDGSLVEIVEDE